MSSIETLEKKYVILNKAFKTLIDTNKKNEERLEKLEKYVQCVEGRVQQSDKENWQYIKELQDNKFKVDSDIKVVDDKLSKIDEEIARITANNSKCKGHSESKAEKQLPAMFECNKCDSKFHAKENLMYHINTRHPKAVMCKMCDIPFKENHEVELHMELVHKRQRQFKCDKCEMENHLKWRLRKHMAMHEEVEIRKCHYFNNGKVCPFQKVGCKFLHEKADFCEFKENCGREKCQYQH